MAGDGETEIVRSLDLVHQEVVESKVAKLTLWVPWSLEEHVLQRRTLLDAVSERVIDTLDEEQCLDVEVRKNLL